MQRQFASFYLGDSLFGIDVLYIREINTNLDITKINPSPEYLVGLMNLRGQIVAVINLSKRIGFTNESSIETSYCIVLKTTKELDRIINEGLLKETTSSDTVGLLVDRIGDMITVDESLIELPPANINGIDSKYLQGVIKLEKELMTTFQMKEILAM